MFTDEDGIKFLSGGIVWYRSSELVRRGFCGRCGSPVAYERVDEGAMVIWIGTFDRPENWEPHFHWWTESRIPWVDICHNLPDGTADLESYKIATQTAADC